MAELDPETGKPLAALQFAQGAFHATSLAIANNSLYVGGYGTEGMEIHTRQAKIQKSGLPGERETTATPFIHRHDPLVDKRRDGRGRPMVLRLPLNLSGIQQATFLEGWHHIWHIPRPLKEDRESPVGVAAMANGDLVVVHDGGQMIPGNLMGKSKGFYQAHDHLSRLNPDLSQRRWHQKIITPLVEPSRSKQLEGPDFQSNWMGSVRSLRLRVDPLDRIYVSGWSASQTMDEPWWSSFLIQFSPTNGEPVWSGWTVDPTSGGGGRMNGLVSDSVVRSIAFDDEGRLLAALNSDGGNTITRNAPTDFTQERGPKLQGDSPWGLKGRTLFIGSVQRLNPERTEREGGAYVLGRDQRKATAAWPIDLCGVSGERVLVVGRYTTGFQQKTPWGDVQGPGSFIRLYSPTFGLTFSSGLTGADLRHVTRKGNRILVTGSTRSTLFPGKHVHGELKGGERDGCVLLLEVPAE